MPSRSKSPKAPNWPSSKQVLVAVSYRCTAGRQFAPYQPVDCQAEPMAPSVPAPKKHPKPSDAIDAPDARPCPATVSADDRKGHILTAVQLEIVHKLTAIFLGNLFGGNGLFLLWLCPKRRRKWGRKPQDTAVVVDRPRSWYGLFRFLGSSVCP